VTDKDVLSKYPVELQAAASVIEPEQPIRDDKRTVSPKPVHDAAAFAKVGVQGVWAFDSMEFQNKPSAMRTVRNN
jgi:hypothetical protein